MRTLFLALTLTSLTMPCWGAAVEYRYVGYGETTIPATSDAEHILSGRFALDDTLFGTSQPILGTYEFAGPSQFDSSNSFVSRSQVLTDEVGRILKLDIVLGAVDEGYHFTQRDWVYTGPINFDGVVQHQVESVKQPIVKAPPQPTVDTISVDWVAVGDTRNSDYFNHGRVDYGYRISRYEITNAQYAGFLNRKSQYTHAEDLGLYDERMWSDPRGGIVRDGSGVGLTPYRYRVKPTMADKPVNFISFFDALRFTNWLNNGQGNGSTEDGAYTLIGGTEVPSNVNELQRNPDAIFFLPTANEWFKAGYYEPDVSGNDYWRYATRSDDEPEPAEANSSGVIINPGTNVVNYQRGADWNLQDGNVVSVGGAGLLSESYYGAADMNGNVWEWTEEMTSLVPVFRNVYGGSYWDPSVLTIPSAGRDTRLESTATTGFRVVAKGLGLTGDFDWDDRFSPMDIDLLTEQTFGAEFDPLFDLNRDQDVNQLDRSIWIRTIAKTLPGDADLNGRVEFSDFLALSRGFGNQGGWGNGDFDGSGWVEFPDFLILSSNFSNRVGSMPVPEPRDWTLLFGGVVLWLRQRSTRNRCRCADLGSYTRGYTSSAE